MKYWVQNQAPSGNWVDSLGTDDLNIAVGHRDYNNTKGEISRIVCREDTVVGIVRCQFSRNNVQLCSQLTDDMKSGLCNEHRLMKAIFGEKEIEK